MNDFQTIIKKRNINQSHHQPEVYHGLVQFYENGHFYFAHKYEGLTVIWECWDDAWDLIW